MMKNMFLSAGCKTNWGNLLLLSFNLSCPCCTLSQRKSTFRVITLNVAAKRDTTRNISCSIMFSSTFHVISRKFGLLSNNVSPFLRSFSQEKNVQKSNFLSVKIVIEHSEMSC